MGCEEKVMNKSVDDVLRMKQWSRYWRNSLIDAESSQGTPSQKDLSRMIEIDRTVYREGQLPAESPELEKLFDGEPKSVQIVRVVLRPAIYKSLLERGQKKLALYPEVVTPLVCGLWVARDGRFFPAAVPNIPRDLLQPQADDCFTLAHVAQQDIFLSKEEVQIYSESEALSLLEMKDDKQHTDIWNAYYIVSQQLFETLGLGNFLSKSFGNIGKARLVKIDPLDNPARHIVGLYDWLADCKSSLPLLQSYALENIAQHQPCVEPFKSMASRLGHANTQYPLALAQRDALAQAIAMQNGEVLAINGPPGTGKTTFVLSVVASLWVKAALEETEPPLIIAASTNNQAVTNVLEAFAEGFEESEEGFGGRWFPDIGSYGGYFPARSRESKASQRYQTATFYRETESSEYIARAEKTFLARAQQVFADTTLTQVAAVKAQLHKHLVNTQKQLTDLQHSWAELQQSKEHWSALVGAATHKDVWDREQSQLRTLREAVTSTETDLQRWQGFCADESLLLILLSVLPPVARKRRLKKALFIKEHFCLASKELLDKQGESDQVLPETVLAEYLVVQRQTVGKQEELLNKLRGIIAQGQSAQRSLTDAWSALAIHRPVPSTFNELDQALDITLRFKLFQLAVHYWEARWLQDCSEQSKELAEQESNNKEKTGLKSVRPRWHRRMKLTPCIVSTLHSLPAHMTYQVYDGGEYPTEYLINEIDLLIIDEAGQVAPDVAGASMALAKRVLAIGDVQQIKPVANLSSAIDVGNMTQQGLITSSEEYKQLLLEGRSVVDGSVMRIAQSASRYQYLAKAEPGMFLREHRRCLDGIISYCNDLCYQGLLQPLRNSTAIDPELPPFAYVHVDGRVESPASGSRINRLEAITIAQWLSEQRSRLESVHKQPLEKIVGVVTPFKAQAHLIAQECMAYGIKVGSTDDAMTVGTVHALQGAERAVVVFSSVYSRHDDGPFIDQDSALLNVAVSRAKDSFIVFGDMDVIGAAAPGTPRHLLGKYLFKNECNALDFASKTARPDLLERLQTPQIISNSEEHDKCLQHILAQAQRRVVIVSPWVKLERLEETGLLAKLQHAVENKIEVVLYTDEHFNTTTSNQLDENKHKAFEQCCKTLAKHGLAVHVVKQVHSKIILADDSILCVGSYNWASAAREGPYKNMETSIFYSGYLKEEIDTQLKALNARRRKTY